METEYIEAYFEQTLDDHEKTAFENRISNDKDFAGDVAFYIGARQKLRQQLLKQKQVEWSTGNNNKGVLPSIAPVKKIGVSKWWSYVAAACLLLFAAFYLFEKKSGNPQQLASNYIAKELLHIGLTMDGARDSMQLGKAAFNNKQYEKALQYFIGVANAHPENNDAKRLIGNVYLVTNNYDKALQQFDELANVKGLYSNPGLFYKAVTLMERNKADDVKKAKSMLEQVVKENLAHSEEAKDWLKEF